MRSVTINRRTSRDAACTMIIGKDAPLGPSCVKVTSDLVTTLSLTNLYLSPGRQHHLNLGSDLLVAE